MRHSLKAYAAIYSQNSFYLSPGSTLAQIDQLNCDIEFVKSMDEACMQKETSEVS